MAYLQNTLRIALAAVTLASVPLTLVGPAVLRAEEALDVVELSGEYAALIEEAPAPLDESALFAPAEEWSAPLAEVAAAATPVPTVVPSPTPQPAAAPAPTAAPLPTTLRAPGHFIYGAVLADPKGSVNAARAAGLTHVSAFVPWQNVEPSKGRYLFKEKESWGAPVANDLTNVVEAARAANLKVVLRLDEPPAWAGGKMYRLDPADVERYVYEAVSYGKGTITHVEVFNEPNLPFEWGTAPVDPAGYVRLLVAANRGAKRADPGVSVISAAISPRTGGYGGTMEDVDFLDAIYKAGAKGHFDLLGIHAYLGNFAPEAPSECVPMCLRTLELLRAVMERNGDAAKGAYVTEIGVLQSTPQDLGAYEWMEVPAEQRAENLVKGLHVLNAAYPWVRGANVFNLDYAVVPWVPATSPMHWFSLLNPDRSPRPAYNRIKDARATGQLP
ncbi:MAG TPA: hypothetical protein VFX49_05385 [Chloroflexota bacterium]|nr:hypothetical protein [Chloroflexota bacterium]